MPMKNILSIVVALMLPTMAISQTASPELVSSAGDSFKNSTYQLDWSVGECVTTTHTAGSYTVTQGFHQSNYEVATLIDNLNNVAIDVKVYPNPTSDFIIVSFNNFPSSGGHGNVLKITDINGKILLQEKINQQKKQLDFSSYSNGIYFLSVKQGNQLLKSFKIIKND